ncbi:MAG: palmitoyltransferase swf1 [Caeruleum heppii]|nr:MAG: palmitoyltransferase swf1 [Caeruleum heppii]
MSLLLSTGVLTSYGAYVAHMLMSSTLQIAYFVSVQRDQAATSDRVLQDRSWSGGLTWAEYGNAWGWAILEDRSIGTTTNETGKWTELKEDMADGIVVKAKRSRVIFSPSDNKQEAGKEADDVEPAVEWPAMTDQVLRRLEEDEEDPVEGGIWQKVWSLAEVENMYDLGFWDNLMDTVFS